MPVAAPRRSLRVHKSSCIGSANCNNYYTPPSSSLQVKTLPSVFAGCTQTEDAHLNTQRRLFVNAHLLTPHRKERVRDPNKQSDTTESSHQRDCHALDSGEVSSDEEVDFSPPVLSPLRLVNQRSHPSNPSSRGKVRTHSFQPYTGAVQPLTAPIGAAETLLTLPGATQPPSNRTGGTQSPTVHTGITQLPSTIVGTTQRQVTYFRPTLEGQEQHVGTNQASEKSNDAAEDLRRLFVHLNRVTVHEQKSMASAFNVAQVGNKKVRAARLFVVISGIMQRKNRSALEVITEKATEKGKDFETEYGKTIKFWSSSDKVVVAPPISELEALSGVQQHPHQRSRSLPIDDMLGSDSEGEQENRSSCAAAISLEEFARLMIIFRDHPEAANDLRSSGQDLTRQQLDISTSRHAFWTDRIERLFNDRGVLTNEQLDGPLSHIDPGRPLVTHRSGSCLQDAFSKFRKEFTEKYSKWNVSGNLDPATFVNFCRLSGQTTLTRPGARCLIAWKIFRFGTPQQNDLLLDFCSREMGVATGAQLESGIGANGESGVTSRKGRSRPSMENSNLQANMALSNALNAFSKSTQSEDPMQKKARVEIEELKVIQARNQNQRTLVNNFVEAKKLMETNADTDDSRFQSILRNYYLSLAEKLEDGMF